MIYLIIGLVAWIVSSVLTYGFLFSYCQNEFPSVAEESIEDDKKFAFLFSVLGLVGLLAVIFTHSYEHGLKFK